MDWKLCSIKASTPKISDAQMLNVWPMLTFEIIGHPHGDYGLELGLKPYPRELKDINKGLRDGDLYYMKDGKPELPYRRILIRKKQS